MKGRALLLGVALAWAGSAGATDLRLSLGAASEYDSNVFRREKDDNQRGAIEDDAVIVATPELELLDSEGKFTYDVGYQFPWQRSITTDALRGFDHAARIGADYHMDDRNQFSFSNRFDYQQALNNQFGDTPQIQSNSAHEHIFRNRASLSARHRFSERLGSELRFDQQIFYTDQSDRSDNQQYTLTGSLDHLLTERQTLSGGLQGTYQHFRESSNDPNSDAFFLGPFIGWSYRIDEQSDFHMSVGPSYVHDHADTLLDPDRTPADAGIPCGTSPLFPQDQCSKTDDSVTVFGNAEIDRRWSPTHVTALGYERRQDTASGVSGSAILDAVDLTHTWSFAQRWTLSGRADWTKRKSASNVQSGQDDLDTQRWGFGSVLSYAFTRNLTGSLRYQFSKQNSKGNSAGSRSDYDAHIVTLGVQYNLDPIEVW